MSWDDYVKSMVGPDCQDAAIYGQNPPCVWACHPGGIFSKITPVQIQELLSADRNPLFINGVCLGTQKCSLIRDALHSPDSYMMDLRTKAAEGPTFNIAICKTNSALIFAMGAEGVYGGAIHTKTHDVGKYLRDQNC
ncbi:profilin-1-like [Pseudophryne corroboree]|uniref:profilin-1-like n=1 Tax=Pseudophryne corroboree TaxID=495146 RepID=UPI003081ADA1